MNGSSPARGRHPGARFWWDSAGALLSAALCVATLLDAEWIELVFGVDPDHGSGALEWSIVLATAAVAALLSLQARRAWRGAAQEA